ncbi:MAG: beta-galactosidase [Anaerolineales bacterium]|nr:beta-galactosidase [Anaerolineales bacterium]
MPTYFESVTTPLLAAEFSYFRLPREKWELMLTRLRQMGVNALTLTMPWGFHETEPGTVDLTGTANSRRDVVGLVQLCAALNFVCILKPGPYTGEGVLGQGLPIWLLHRSDDLETALPEAVSYWFKAFSRMLAGQQWPHGPIVALHVESEPGETSSPALSPQLTEVKWPIWLRKHYEGIEALNAAYGTAYRTVNQVSFPKDWATARTPQAEDARTFLETVRHESQSGYRQILLDQGWQIPIYLVGEAGPALQNFNLTNPTDLTALSQPQKTRRSSAWLNLQRTIQVDPDAADVGCGPVWAAGAPIRADGSARPSFWLVRQCLWSHVLPEVQRDDQTLRVAWKNGHIVTRSGDASLKLELSASARAVYRLRFSGELVAETSLKASRGKLSGLYQAEDAAGQTDLILLLNDAAAPLSDFPLTYLSHLLAAQAQTLSRSAALAVSLAETLASGEANPAAAPARPPKTSYILEESRRSLREADAALRKALTSISALEGGFATILGKETSQSAAASLAINPAIFEGQAREVLTELGAACAKIGPSLQAAADEIRHTATAPDGFTIAQYQQSYTLAKAAARAAREPLLKMIALLRLEIAAERLPLVAWRVHHQVQELAESLRWGVLRA